MKKKKIIILSLLVLMILISITGCSSDTVEQDNEKIKVYTSFYPMYDFTSKIGGDKISVYNMVPSGTEPHDWEPAASDIVNLEKADLFVYNGAGMEHWVENVLSTLENKDLVVVEASQGIELLGSEDHHDHDHDHDHYHGEFDAHVWTDPLNVKIEMENIMKGLIQIDPYNQEYYEENYEKYSEELDILHEEFEGTISNLTNRDIVVSHMAFSYMSHAYGLNQISIDGLTPDSEPNPGRMAEIIDFVKDNNIKVIFFEELASPKIADAIANETDAVVDVLNPIEGLSDEELENGDDYFSVMRKNLEALSSALE
ncbi:MAG: zinc ABC transporter solute-binding protein [Tissierella sp.]|nr:zinc ABC transporter solute-binding protein [Tissierella sp.]